jgi:hypothetical protein
MNPIKKPRACADFNSLPWRFFFFIRTMALSGPGLWSKSRVLGQEAQFRKVFHALQLRNAARWMVSICMSLFPAQLLYL